LYNLKQNLFVQSNVSSEDQEIIMRLAPLYQQDRTRAIEQGRQEEGLSLILRQLNRRLGSISPNLVEKIGQLSLPMLEDLGEALLDFTTETDLLEWLNNHQ
jgi:hypothetical protein